MEPKIIFPIDNKNVATLKFGVNDKIIDELKINRPNKIRLDVGPWNNVDFLLLINESLTDLYIGDETFDWSILPKLKSLEKLNIGGWFKCDIEFGLLNRLKYLETYWNQGYDDRFFEIKNLKALRIHGFKDVDFRGVRKLQNLEYLGVWYSRGLTSILGVEELNKLRRLDLINCPSISDISSLSGNIFLESIRIESCKKLKSIAGIENCKALKELNIFDIGEITSLSMLKNIRSLERLIFDTKISDGNLEFIYDLHRLDLCEFKNKRNYSVKSEEIKKYLIGRGGFTLDRFSGWYAYNDNREFPDRL